MKKNSKVVVLFLLAGSFLISTNNLLAGDVERSGQAGATQLLINPWARSSGWAGANVAGVKGLEAMFLNVAGTAFTKKTEILYARTNWLQGSGININAFGMTQHVGETGALGLTVMSFGFGDIDITTYEKPDGGSLGNLSPQFLNIGLSYAKGFSDNIYGGLTVKVVSEKTPNVAASAVAFDAGIQYISGKRDQLKFGISLKNIGTRMSFSGDALDTKAAMPQTSNEKFYTVQNRSETILLPSLLNIGFGYDFYFRKDSASMKTHIITAMGNFTSNSYEENELKFGVEYAWKSMLMVRVGYAYQDNILSSDLRTTALTGPTAGFTVEVPVAKSKSTFGIDYSYRASNPFQGVHSIGVRINL